MSIHNQLITAATILSEIPPATLVTMTRDILKSFEDPAHQDDYAFPTAEGMWLSVGTIKRVFGPEYASDRIVIEQVISVLVGQLIASAVEEVGLDVEILNPLQILALTVVTLPIEHQAFIQMTTN